MKPRRQPPPVDAFPDVAWTRLERELWTRLDRETTPPPPQRDRRWMWLALPAAAVAAVVLVVVTRNYPAPAIEDAPSRVVAGDAPSAVSFGDAHIELDARSALVMQSDRHTVVLDNGAAWFTVGPRGDRPAFEVRAGDATVRVIGTRFRVAREGEQVAVAVDHGVVAVDFRGSHVELTAGRSWSSTNPDEVASAQLPVPEVAAPVAAAPEVAAPVEPATVPEIPAPVEAKPTPDHRAAHPPITPRCDADCVRYRALAKLEASYPDVAIKGYLELSQGSGEWAANALYAAGRLTADRHDPRAPTLLSIYLHRFPTGANVKDVTVLLTRLKGTSP